MHSNSIWFISHLQKGSFTNYVYKKRLVGSPKMSIFIMQKLSTRRGGGEVGKKSQKLVNIVCERPQSACPWNYHQMIPSQNAAMCTVHHPNHHCSTHCVKFLRFYPQFYVRGSIINYFLKKGISVI